MSTKLSGVREYIYSSPFLLNIQKRDNFMTASYYITGINQDILLNFEEDPNKYVSSEFIINNINVKKKFNKNLYKSYYLLSTTLNTTLFDDGVVNLLDVLISENDYITDMGGITEDEDSSESLPHLFPSKEEFYLYLIRSYINYQRSSGSDSSFLQEESPELYVFQNGFIPFMKLEGSFLDTSGNIKIDAITTADCILNYNVTLANEDGVWFPEVNNNFLRIQLGEEKILKLLGTPNDDPTGTTQERESILKEMQALMNTQLFFERYFYGNDYTLLYEDGIDFTSDNTYPIKNYIIDWSHDFRETNENGFVFAKNLDKSFISYVPSITFKNVITKKVIGSDSGRKIIGYVDMDICSYNLNEQTFTFQGNIETLESFNGSGNLEMSYGVHRMKYHQSGVESDGLLVSADNKYSYYNNKININIKNENDIEKWSFDVSFPENGLYFNMGLMVGNEIAYKRQLFGRNINDDRSGMIIRTDNAILKNNVYHNQVLYTIKPVSLESSASEREANMIKLNSFFNEYSKYEAFDTGFDIINEKIIAEQTSEDRRNNYGRLSSNRIFYLGMEEFVTDNNNNTYIYNPSYYCLTNTYETAEDVRFFRSLNDLLHSNVLIRNNYTSTGGEAPAVTEGDYNNYINWLNEDDRTEIIESFKSGELTNDNEIDVYYPAWLADQNFVLVEGIPVIGSEFYNKNDKNQNYIEGILYNYYSSIKDNLDAIEGNFDIDMKFYNSYGPSKILTTNKNNAVYNINKTNISLSFSIKLDVGTTLDETLFKRSIVEYVNKCNSVRDINMYIFKLVTQLQSEFTNILYIQYNGMPNLVEGIGDENSVTPETTPPNYQLITYTSNEITTEQDIIPEYLTIDRKTNENNVTELVPNIIINYL